MKITATCLKVTKYKVSHAESPTYLVPGKMFQIFSKFLLQWTDEKKYAWYYEKKHVQQQAWYYEKDYVQQQV